MLLDLESRTVSLSVGECSSFSAWPAWQAAGFTGSWRMESGRQWHQTLGEQAHASDPQTCLEHLVEGELRHRGWVLKLKGRIDQWLPASSGGRIREIKTVRARLPDDGDNLWSDFPDYFHQTALYLELMRQIHTAAGGALAAELVFLDIDDGLSQVVPLHKRHEKALTGHLDQLVDYLETRRRAREQLQQLPQQAPFAAWRPGQEDASARLKQLLDTHPTVLFEAPTGFGKTGIVLDAAIDRIRSGSIDRIIFLTGKSSGQLAAFNQLTSAYGDPQSLLFYRMRNRDQHDAGLLQSPGLSEAEQRARWLQAGIQPLDLFANGTVELETVRRLGETTGVSPFEISRLLLRYAQVWIGDYNYLFHPGSNGVFLQQPDFDAARTLVIIDEAHNLPNRVEDAWSASVRAGDLQELLHFIHDEWSQHPLIRELDRMLRWLPRMPVGQELDPPDEAFASEWFAAVGEHIQSLPIDWSELPELVRETLWNLLGLVHLQTQALNHSLLWKPRADELACSCLDAAPLIRDRLRPFARSVLLSATLGPLETFQQRCGLDPQQCIHLQGKAEWIDRAYKVAIDLRVDTRYRKRRDALPQIGRNLAELRDNSTGAVLAFAPSYEFAHQIEQHLAFHHPSLRVAQQPRERKPIDPESFLEHALPFCDILLLVMGSPFAESIDQLGGKVAYAVLISPGIPSRDFLSERRYEADRGPERERFFRHFQVPGMIRVNQAMGRLVRDPAHRVNVVLLCQRFAETTTARLLPGYCSDASLVADETDWQQWLRFTRPGESAPGPEPRTPDGS